MEKILLTKEEENSLALIIEEGYKAKNKLDSEKNLSLSIKKELEIKYNAGIKARDQLFEANRNLVYHMAKSYAKKGVELADLHQSGLMGLQKAAETFRANAGAKFSTYASYWIMDQLNKCVYNDSRTIRLPQKVYQAVNKYLYTVNMLENKNGKAPSLEEIAYEMDITKDEAFNLMEASYGVNSLDSYVDFDNKNTYADIVSDNGTLNPIENYMKEDLNEKLYLALKRTLDKREYQIVEKHFGLNNLTPKSFEEIGKELNISRERTRQIFNGSLIKLRNSEYADDLKMLMHVSC